MSFDFEINATPRLDFNSALITSDRLEKRTALQTMALFAKPFLRRGLSRTLYE